MTASFLFFLALPKKTLDQGLEEDETLGKTCSTGVSDEDSSVTNLPLPFKSTFGGECA